MKQIRILTIIMVITVLIMAACEPSSDSLNLSDDIAGTYKGSLTSITKILSNEQLSDDAFVEIRRMTNDLIEVHMYHEDLDSLFMLNYYDHLDSTMVCLTGNDFEFMYGHMLGQGHTGGNMMGHMQNNETEWMHHLSDEHHEGDEHFGGFNRQMQTFEYRFTMKREQIHYEMFFQGQKIEN